jgi:DNA mismatch endonuclease (patch repair protein)
LPDGRYQCFLDGFANLSLLHRTGLEMAEGTDQAWVSTEAGRHLAKRRTVGTNPELLLRGALFQSGLRYRLSRVLSPGCRPDLVFVGQRLAVFVDGCFWHGCPAHGTFRFRGPNSELWEAKLRRNRRNDDRANAIANSLGYRVLRLWECSITKSPAASAKFVFQQMKGQQAGIGIVRLDPATDERTSRHRR